MKLSHRLALIGVLIALSAWMLIPRTVKERKLVNGVTQIVETKREPIKLGLDLKGGMHVALGIDESKGTVANKSDAIDRALKLVF